MRDFGGHLLHLQRWGESGIVAQQLTSVEWSRGFTSNSLAERRGTRYLSLHLGVL